MPFFITILIAAFLISLNSTGWAQIIDDTDDEFPDENNPDNGEDENDPNDGEDENDPVDDEEVPIEDEEEESNDEPTPAPPPLDEPEVPIEDIIGKTPTAFPYTVARAIRSMVMMGLPGRRWEFNLEYEDIAYRGVEGNSILIVGGHERTFSPWGMGILVPVQRWDLDGFEEYWQVGVVPYVFTAVNDIGRIGAFVEADRSFSDIEELGEETSWAAGVFATYPIMLSETVTITPVGIYEYYWTGQDAFSDASLFTVGPKLDFPIGDKIFVGVFVFYTFDAENDEIDDAFWEYGATLTYLIKETWGITVGYQTIEDAEDFEYNKYFLGAQLNF